MATPKTILLQGQLVSDNYRPTYEALRGETLTPGTLSAASTGKLTHFANTARWQGMLLSNRSTPRKARRFRRLDDTLHGRRTHVLHDSLCAAMKRT